MHNRGEFRTDCNALKEPVHLGDKRMPYPRRSAFIPCKGFGYIGFRLRLDNNSGDHF